MISPIAPEDDGDSKDDESGIPQSQEFTEAGIIKLLEECISLLEQGEYYEHAISIYKLLTAIYEKSQNYKKLASCYEQMRILYENIDQSTKLKNRYFATYYRVTMYGSAVPEELNGKQFIYKMPKLYKLFQMVKKVKEMFTNIEVDKLPDHADLSKLDPNKIYVQITNVKPYIEHDNTRKTIFQRNTNIHQYYYETPFIKDDGKDTDSNLHAVTKTYKRKVILTIEQHFPSVKTRMPVVDIKEIMLTPIESATEVIAARCQTLIECMEADPPDVQTLHMHLQGAVCAVVNGGPSDIVRLFLGEREKYEEKLVKVLNEKCHQFLRLCNRALKMSAELIQPHQKAFHLELEKGYSQTEEQFLNYLLPLDVDMNSDGFIEHEMDDTPTEDEQAIINRMKPFRLSIPRQHFREFSERIRDSSTDDVS
jgi:hypothetical protein